ncbi:hypothetical protein M405DRAFT_816280 [Rhizopogon salebrosus TDB-379]|nr:hypothetical protein M405DRAFT_816280 [Rhizopogon salebrosus TDB-379]
MDDYFPDSIGFQTVAVFASLAALLFDFSITFDSEVRWTWGRNWGITRIAFVVSRYLPFVGLAMTVYCEYMRTYDTICWLGIVAAEVMLLVRTYVVWGCDRKFLIVLLVFTTVTALSTAGLANMIITSEPEDPTRGVFEQDGSTSITYGLLTFYELVLMSLTLYKRFKFYRIQSSPMAATIHRNGVIYMLCIALVSMSNCISIVVLPSSYTALLAGPQLVIHSVLASRILFNLRVTNELTDVVASEAVALGEVISQPIAFQTASRVDHAEIWLSDL